MPSEKLKSDIRDNQFEYSTFNSTNYRTWRISGTIYPFPLIEDIVFGALPKKTI